MDEYEERFLLTNEKTHVAMVDPPAEVNEREIQRIIDLLKDPKTVGVYALVIQRPVPEFPERLQAHHQFIPLEIGAATLFALLERSVPDVGAGLIDMFGGEEE